MIVNHQCMNIKNNFSPVVFISQSHILNVSFSQIGDKTIQEYKEVNQCALILTKTGMGYWAPSFYLNYKVNM